MHQRLITDYCLVVKRETARVVLKRLDPEGVDLRSRRAFRRRLYSVQGPNYMWHLDGYDKLKPFGFALHGASWRFMVLHGASWRFVALHGAS